MPEKHDSTPPPDSNHYRDMLKLPSLGPIPEGADDDSTEQRISHLKRQLRFTSDLTVQGYNREKIERLLQKIDLSDNTEKNRE